MNIGLFACYKFTETAHYFLSQQIMDSLEKITEAARQQGEVDAIWLAYGEEFENDVPLTFTTPSFEDELDDVLAVYRANQDRLHNAENDDEHMTIRIYDKLNPDPFPSQQQAIWHRKHLEKISADGDFKASKVAGGYIDLFCMLTHSPKRLDAMAHVIEALEDFCMYRVCPYKVIECFPCLEITSTVAGFRMQLMISNIILKARIAGNALSSLVRMNQSLEYIRDELETNGVTQTHLIVYERGVIVNDANVKCHWCSRRSTTARAGIVVYSTMEVRKRTIYLCRHPEFNVASVCQRETLLSHVFEDGPTGRRVNIGAIPENACIRPFFIIQQSVFEEGPAYLRPFLSRQLSFITSGEQAHSLHFMQRHMLSFFGTEQMLGTRPGVFPKEIQFTIFQEVFHKLLYDYKRGEELFMKTVHQPMPSPVIDLRCSETIL